MRLLSLVLFDRQGRSRTISFKRGLNVITGNSATGKSALLDMVEYCLGRDILNTPIGPIRETVAWYGLLVELANQRAFIGRPAPAETKGSSQLAMLEFGIDLEVPPFERLRVNADARSVREQLGRAIGIEETVPRLDLSVQEYQITLAHAVLFCLQAQAEVANRSLLFHRQGEERMPQTIREVLPYFLGALTPDAAIVQQQLLHARRELRAAETELRFAEATDREMEVTLKAFLDEAIAASLLNQQPPEGRIAGVEALESAVVTVRSDVALDDTDAAQRELFKRVRDELRMELHAVGKERAFWEILGADERDFRSVVEQQASRLRSIELLGNDENVAADICPLCNSHLAESDPTVAELIESAAQIQQQVGRFAVSRPRRLVAIEGLTARAAELRRQVRSVDESIEGLEAAQRQVSLGRSFAERQAFLQGRIQRYLETLPSASADSMTSLRNEIIARQAAVERLESLLDPNEVREQLTSRLLAIGKDMTSWAEALELEHSGFGVRLEASKLTVIADTPSGPAPLNQFGSAANWIGYHVVAHLALHKFFVEQDRPVPHFIMFDQPTQAYYPSDAAKESGEPATDADREAVLRLFRLMVDVSGMLDNRLQVVVCDHANLAEPWFQESVIENWRDGAKLIQEDWLS